MLHSDSLASRDSSPATERLSPGLSLLALFSGMQPSRETKCRKRRVSERREFGPEVKAGLVARLSLGIAPHLEPAIELFQLTF